MLTDPGGRNHRGFRTAERRLDSRIETSLNLPITCQLPEGRIEGHVVDESEGGLGVMFPHDSPITQGDRIRVIYKREARFAKVMWTREDPNGTFTGLQWI